MTDIRINNYFPSYTATVTFVEVNVASFESISYFIRDSAIISFQDAGHS